MVDLTSINLSCGVRSDYHPLSNTTETLSFISTTPKLEDELFKIVSSRISEIIGDIERMEK